MDIRYGMIFYTSTLSDSTIVECPIFTIIYHKNCVQSQRTIFLRVKFAQVVVLIETTIVVHALFIICSQIIKLVDLAGGITKPNFVPTHLARCLTALIFHSLTTLVAVTHSKDKKISANLLISCKTTVVLSITE